VSIVELINTQEAPRERTVIVGVQLSGADEWEVRDHLAALANAIGSETLPRR